MKKILKVVSNVLTVLVIIIALLLIVTVFPITGNAKVLTVLSGSMEPAIKTGSVVVVKPVESYKIGDVITFGEISKTDTPTTHRIYDMRVRSGKPIYITKGDANDSPDPKEVFERDVVGKVLFSVPWIGYLISAVQKPIGFAVVIVVPAILIAYGEIKKIKEEVKKMIKKKKGKDVNQDEKIKELQEKIEKLKSDKK